MMFEPDESSVAILVAYSGFIGDLAAFSLLVQVLLAHAVIVVVCGYPKFLVYRTKLCTVASIRLCGSRCPSLPASS